MVKDIHVNIYIYIMLYMENAISTIKERSRTKRVNRYNDHVQK